MGPVLFIGDRLTAAGFRLGGARIAAPAEAAGLLAEPPAGVRLILITAEAAGTLDAAQLQGARRRLDPALLVVPDVRGRVPPEDTAARLKQQLGMAE